MTREDGDLLRELGNELPWDKPSGERREALRSSLLVAASESTGRASSKRWIVAGGAFAAGVLAAAAIALVVVRSDRPDKHDPIATQAPTAIEPAGYAQIEASSAAELERTRVASTTGVDETVRIRGGRVRLVVPPVRAGDHVRAKTGDAEVEGTGAFEIVVVADALDQVTVSTGTASVRVKSATQPVFLSAGETWHAKTITASIDLTAAPSPSAASAPSTDAVASPATPRFVEEPATATKPAVVSKTQTRPRTSAVPTQTTTPEPHPVAAASVAEPLAIAAAAPPPPLVKGRTETERHFQAGLALERAGKYAEAAIELGLAADAGSDALAVDARYFQAVSLVKAGMGSAAEKAIVEFLDHAPTSVRRGRAAVLLARLYADRGNSLAARQWYESAKDDADPAVAAAARQGIAALK